MYLVTELPPHHRPQSIKLTSHPRGAPQVPTSWSRPRRARTCWGRRSPCRPRWPGPSTPSEGTCQGTRRSSELRGNRSHPLEGQSPGLGGRSQVQGWCSYRAHCLPRDLRHGAARLEHHHQHHLTWWEEWRQQQEENRHYWTHSYFLSRLQHFE